MQRLLVLALLLLLAACAARGERFLKVDLPPPTQSVIYVFRTQYVPRSMDLSPGIAVNGTEVGALLLDGYLRIQVPPGRTEIRMLNRAYLWPGGAPLRSIQIDAQPGKAHFVEFSVESSEYKMSYEAGRTINTTYLGVALREVGEDTAMRFLPKLKNAN